MNINSKATNLFFEKPGFLVEADVTINLSMCVCMCVI